MRYIVVVEIETRSTKEFSVEAATENEASLTATKLAIDHAGFVSHLDVVSVKEDLKPDHNELDRGKGYLARLI